LEAWGDPVSLRPYFGIAWPFGRRPRAYAGIRLVLDRHRKHTAGAELVVVLGLILIALARAQLAPTQDQMTAQRIIINDWPALTDACIAPTVQRLPDGKLHAWCRNGERFHIELTSPPSVLRCDTVFRAVIQCRW
jgi:hypothetical protein